MKAVQVGLASVIAAVIITLYIANSRRPLLDPGRSASPSTTVTPNTKRIHLQGEPSSYRESHEATEESNGTATEGDARVDRESVPVRVRGRVEDENGHSVPGIALLVATECGGEFAHTESDVSGHFECTIRLKPTNRICNVAIQSASDDPRVIGVTKGVWGGGASALEVRIYCCSQRVRLSGRILYQDLLPVRKGFVRVPGSDKIVLADRFGNYSLEAACPNGVVRLEYGEIEILGEYVVNYRVTGRPGVPSWTAMHGIDLIVQGGTAECTVCVMNASGSAIPRAILRIDGDSHTSSAGDDGCARVVWRGDRPRSLRVSAPGYCDAWVGLPTSSSNQEAVTVVMPTANMLRGRIVDEHGAGAAGVDVNVMRPQSGPTDQFVTRSDDEGWFEIALCGGDPYFVVYAAHAHRGVVVSPMTEAFLEEPIVLRLAKPERIVGVVREVGGSPISRAVVVAFRSDRSESVPYSTFSKENGAFELSVPNSGKYLVAASRQGYVRHELLIAAPGIQDFLLERAGWISGRIVSKSFERSWAYSVRVFQLLHDGREKPLSKDLRFQGMREFAIEIPSALPGESCFVEIALPGKAALRLPAVIRTTPDYGLVVR